MTSPALFTLGWGEEDWVFTHLQSHVDGQQAYSPLHCFCGTSTISSLQRFPFLAPSTPIAGYFCFPWRTRSPSSCGSRVVYLLLQGQMILFSHPRDGAVLLRFCLPCSQAECGRRAREEQKQCKMRSVSCSKGEEDSACCPPPQQPAVEVRGASQCRRPEYAGRKHGPDTFGSHMSLGALACVDNRTCC